MQSVGCFERLQKGKGPWTWSNSGHESMGILPAAVGVLRELEARFIASTAIVVVLEVLVKSLMASFCMHLGSLLLHIA